MTKMKDSRIQWLGKVPEHWEISRLKSRISKRFGGCWGEEPTLENMSNTRLCVRIADFDFNTQTVKSSAATMRAYTHSQIYKTKLLDGDIIVEKSGGGEKTPVGRTIIFSSQQFDGSEVLFANFCECFRLKKVESKFFAYLLKTFYQNNDMHLYFNQTTGLQNLDIEAVVNSKVAFPSLDEQERIAAFLDKECSKIDSIADDIEKQIEVLEEYKKSIITETVTKGLNPDVEMKDSGIEWAAKVPNHWNVMPNKYIMSKIKRVCPKYNGQDIISLTTNGVIIRDLDAGGKMPTSFDGYQFVYPGNLLMCLFDYDVTPRCIGLIKDSGLTSPAYSQFVMKNKNSASYYYYYYLMIDNTKELLHLAKNLRHSFTEEQLGMINAPVPPIDEQLAIADYLDKAIFEIDKIISDKKTQLEAMFEYKKSVIYEYVTGKKEVKHDN